MPPPQWDVNQAADRSQGIKVPVVGTRTAGEGTIGETGVFELEFDSLGHLQKINRGTALTPQPFLFVEIDSNPIPSRPQKEPETAGCWILYWDVSKWRRTGNRISAAIHTHVRPHKGDYAVVMWHCASSSWWLVHVISWERWVRLTDREGGTYSWEEIDPTGGCGFAPPNHLPMSGIFNASEVNCSSHNSHAGGNPLVVLLRRTDANDYVFDYGGTNESPGERFVFTP